MAAAEPEVLAHHFMQAALTDAAIEWWGKAGEQALRRSAFQEAISHLGKAIEMADKTGEGTSAAATASVSANQRLKLQTNLGKALMWSRGFGVEESKAAFIRARELAAAIDDPTERFTIYYGLWVGNLLRGELGFARDIAETFLREAERGARTTECGFGRRLLGFTCLWQGDFIEAQANLVEALRSYDPERDREVRFRIGLDTDAAARTCLAITKWQLGEVGPGRALIEEGVAHATETGHVPTLVNTYFYKAHFEIVRGDAGAARRDAEICRQTQPRECAYALCNSGSAAIRLGKRSARRPRGRSDCAWTGIGVVHRPREQTVRAVLSRSTCRDRSSGRRRGSLDPDRWGASPRNETGEYWSDAFLHRLRGEILLKRNPANTAPAEDAFLTAIAIAQQKARSFELRAALSLAKLYQSTDRPADAHAVLASALKGFSPTPELPEIEEAQALLSALTS
jgi:tetratricopeptide (TPR) repeat protein